jgi:hypothetical protein
VSELVFWAGGRLPPDAPGTTVLAWSEEAEQRLRAARRDHVPLAELVSVEDAAAADDAALHWTRAFGRHRLADGRSLLERLSWKGVSLWWFAELYLHHSTGSPRRVRRIEMLHRILERLRPGEVLSLGLPREEAVLLGRVCRALGVAYRGPKQPDRLAARAQVATRVLRSGWDAVKLHAAALKARFADAPPRPPNGGEAILFLSHAAFWRRRPTPRAGERAEYEHYFDRLIPAVARSPGLTPFVVAVGPRAPFRRRGLRDRLQEWTGLAARPAPYVHINRYLGPEVVRGATQARREALATWRVVRKDPAMAAAFSHRGVGFADLAEADLAGTLLLQLPWAVRVYEEIAAALRAARPAAVCLYAESSGLGRAALFACRAAGVPTLGIQHGILYPGYYSYMHGPDDGDCPRPDRTAVFGEAARRFLVEEGRYAPQSLVVTGSPKFDELLEATRNWDRAALRAELGIPEGDRVLLVASRFRGIRETHQSIGSAFERLVRAADALERTHLLVKPHPAERERPYVETIAAFGVRRARVLPPSADLARLLFACDALVTVESLSAVEALVLGRPVVVLNMPTNLGAMVDAGVALGVALGEDPLPALRAALSDPAAQRRLADARARYVDDVARGVDGGATDRILELLRDTLALSAAARGSGPKSPA